jgi:hypothetical protein
VTSKTGESLKGRFRAYPTNRVIAILASSSAVDAAVEDLIAAGIPADAIETTCGEAGLLEIDFAGKRHGLLARIVRAVQGAGALAEYKERFEQALRSGQCLLAVDAAEEDTREIVHQRLKARGARNINFFARLAVQRLEP